MSVYNCEKFPAFVFDLEGTLTNHIWRKHFHDNKQYDQYNLLFPYDGVNEKIWHMFQKLRGVRFDLNGMTAIPHMIILTAKSSAHKEEVYHWLRGYLGLAPSSYNLIMRAESEQHMSSAEFKVDKCNMLSKELDIKLIFDDRDDVIKALTDAGYNVVDVKTLTGEAS